MTTKIPAPSNTIIAELPAATAQTCEGDGCTFNGPEYYFRKGVRLCGRCMDKADDADMPYLTSEYSWQIIREVEDR